MKNKIIIALLSFISLSISINGIAQKCKYKYDKVDPISGEKEQRITVDGNNNFEFSFYRKGNNFAIESYVKMPGSQNFVLPSGSKIDIKLKNKTVLSLASSNEATPVKAAGYSQVISVYAMSYAITEEQLNEIKTNGIVFIRTYLQNGTQYYDYECKDKKTEETKKAATCISQ